MQRAILCDRTLLFTPAYNVKEISSQLVADTKMAAVFNTAAMYYFLSSAVILLMDSLNSSSFELLKMRSPSMSGCSKF